MDASEQFVAWHYLACRIPYDWEVTRYAIEPRIGRIEFCTRYGIEAVFGWEPCSREPDRATTMTDFLRDNVLGRRAARDLRNEHVDIKEIGAFLIGRYLDAAPVQALAYIPEAKRLVRWIFEPSAVRRHGDKLLKRVLKSYSPNLDDPKEIAFCGLRLRLPQCYEIEHMMVLPANVMMLFESDDRRRLTMRRWGLPEMIMGGETIEVFYRRILRTTGARILSSEPWRWGAHEGVRARFSQRGEHRMERFMGRSWTNGVAWAWYDRAARRIYAVEQVGPDKKPLLKLEEVVALPRSR